MDVSKILAELMAERESLDAAIASLEKLVDGRAKPGKGLAVGSGAAPKRRGRPPGSKNKIKPAPAAATGANSAAA